LAALRFATRPYRGIANGRRKPLARYGAMESALRERLLHPSYTINRDMTYAGGQGHAGTSQIGHPLLIKGTLVQKPRFWLFRANALAALAKASDSQEQRPLSRL
jgi:hypothetical protein